MHHKQDMVMMISQLGSSQVSTGLDYEVCWRVIKECPEVPESKEIRWQVFKDIQVMESEQLKIQRDK